MSLGLTKGSVQIVDYDPSWPIAFGAEAKSIERALGSKAKAIHHVGGTSILTCASKPILDIACVVESLHQALSLLEELARVGYGLEWIHRLPDRVSLTKGSPVVAHLHLLERESLTLDQWLRFRDTLRADPALVAEYTSLKRRLAANHPRDRYAYTNGKTAFIQGVLQ